MADQTTPAPIPYNLLIQVAALDAEDAIKNKDTGTIISVNPLRPQANLQPMQGPTNIRSVPAKPTGS